MNRSWTPASRVSITKAGMVIEIELRSVRAGYPAITLEDGQMCIRGLHADLGPYECRIEIPPNHNLAAVKATFGKGTLRIALPRDNNPGKPQPRTMMIYCNGCGKHFDIVVTHKGPQDYFCSSCGKVHTFDAEDFIREAIEQSMKMARKRRGRR
jgi:hypothetical protein